MTTNKINDMDALGSAELLRNINSQDFLNFGLQQIAYIRSSQENGVTSYSVHAADGTPLSMMDSLESAIVMTRYNDLEPLIVN